MTAGLKSGTEAEQKIFSDPLVSIIIPCWNAERYLAEAIASAFSQSYKAIEVIVVDDGSSDKSLDIALLHPDIVIISQKNLGVSTARNVGLEKSRGQFVLFLDADDRLDPDAVKLHINAFSRSPDISMVYGANRIIDPDGRVVGHNPQAARMLNWRDILMGDTPIPSQSMYKRSAIVSSGMFNPDVKLGEDVDLNLRITFKYSGYCHGNVVVDYRTHPSQATKQVSESLTSLLSTIDRFRRSLDKERQRDKIWRRSNQYWKSYFGQYIPFEIARSIKLRDWKRTVIAIRCYMRHLPTTLIGSIQYATWRARQLFAR